MQYIRKYLQQRILLAYGERRFWIIKSYQLVARMTTLPLQSGDRDVVVMVAPLYDDQYATEFSIIEKFP